MKRYHKFPRKTKSSVRNLDCRLYDSMGNRISPVFKIAVLISWSVAKRCLINPTLTKYDTMDRTKRTYLCTRWFGFRQRVVKRSNWSDTGCKYRLCNRYRTNIYPYHPDCHLPEIYSDTVNSANTN